MSILKITVENYEKYTMGNFPEVNQLEFHRDMESVVYLENFPNLLTILEFNDRGKHWFSKTGIYHRLKESNKPIPTLVEYSTDELKQINKEFQIIAKQFEERLEFLLNSKCSSGEYLMITDENYLNYINGSFPEVKEIEFYEFMKHKINLKNFPNLVVYFTINHEKYNIITYLGVIGQILRDQRINSNDSRNPKWYEIYQWLNERSFSYNWERYLYRGIIKRSLREHRIISDRCKECKKAYHRFQIKQRIEEKIMYFADKTKEEIIREYETLNYNDEIVNKELKKERDELASFKGKKDYEDQEASRRYDEMMHHRSGY